ncbi:MAG: hypothetical protein F6J93_21290 [Oscillatoria sp. SIO1A7]|nr:hypothetical protein [Oscillatoria sp. SIO1A7]
MGNWGIDRGALGIGWDGGQARRPSYTEDLSIFPMSNAQCEHAQCPSDSGQRSAVSGQLELKACPEAKSLALPALRGIGLKACPERSRRAES